MLKNLFNWGKGQAVPALPGEAIKQTTPSDETAPQQETGSSNPEPTPDEQPPTIDVDAVLAVDEPETSAAALGTPQYSYATLLGKKLKHYSEIRVDPGFLPRIISSGKPHNTEYQSAKHELLDHAYHGLSPYLDFVRNLKGVAGRNDLYRVLEAIMKRFLARYWDMPASKEHHHAYPWGFTLHSVEVGCGEAETATNWIPMSPHGIDEISHAQHLGMVVLLHFTKGLFHDAHKLFQYKMTGYSQNIEVTFDPVMLQGNVLDFKLVYPNRNESWGIPAENPGRLNGIEFTYFFPRELWKDLPLDQFFDVLTFLFDLTSSAADQESAKRDASLAGRLTLEEMIANAVRDYFTVEKGKTNPASYVFRVNDEWTAVNGGQFFMKIRPVGGGVYTVDGVKACLAMQGVLAVAGEKTLASVYYKALHANGKEIVSKDMSKISFIRSDFLRDAYPEFGEQIGNIFFDEVDRDQILQLCPSADNFISGLAPEKPEQPPIEVDKEEPKQEGTAAETGQAPQAPEAQTADAGKPENENAATDTGTSPQKEETHPANEMQSSPIQVQQAASASKTSSFPTRLRHTWKEQLQWRLDNYDPAYSSPEDGWLFCALNNIYVRIPYFYRAMTNEKLLEQGDWGQIAAGICKNLAVANILILKPLSGTYDYIMPGGRDGKITGDFFEIVIPDKDHTNLVTAVNKSGYGESI